MPLVAYKNLPAFDHLRKEGRTVLRPDRASTQDIREMHIGLLNMMPDKALIATERQFFRLIGESNQIAQIYVHPFSLPGLGRDDDTRSYIETHYETFDDIKAQGLDALIITGANVSDPDLTKATFWEPLQEVMDWSWNTVTSTVCSCLATHALMQFKYGQTRSPLPEKRWGVYRHKTLNREHPLTRGVNTIFDVPHSRFNEITPEQFENAGLHVLSTDSDGAVHMAVSPDGFRQVLFQGHPEYDTISLYKEYKREAMNFRDGLREGAPLFPARYIDEDLRAELNAATGSDEWPFDDDQMRARIENSWADSARSILSNWMGLVYQTTNVDRQKQFMDGIDPNNPLKDF